MIDLPGTYSLFSNSTDEEVARNYIVFEKPDVTLVVLDATSLERNFNLALQVLEMTTNVIICINLIDEAEKQGIKINERVTDKSVRGSCDQNFCSKQKRIPITPRYY